MARQRAYLAVICITDREVLRGDGKVAPAGTRVVYNLGYPSITEIMAQVAYAEHGIGRPVEITAQNGPGQDLWWLRQAEIISEGYVAWAQKFSRPMRGYRRMSAQIAALHLPLLPVWPPDLREEAKKYWATRMDRARRLGYQPRNRVSK